jgi:hypothetical protein
LWWWPCGTGSNVVKKGEKKGSAWTMRRGRGADRSTTRHAAKRMSRCTGFFFFWRVLCGVTPTSLSMHGAYSLLRFRSLFLLLFVAYRALLDVVLFLLYCRALVCYIYIYTYTADGGVPFSAPFFSRLSFAFFCLLFWSCLVRPRCSSARTVVRPPPPRIFPFSFILSPLLSTSCAS